jgi:hypothetical protein
MGGNCLTEWILRADTERRTKRRGTEIAENREGKNRGMKIPACVTSAIEMFQAQKNNKACSTLDEIQSPTPPLGAWYPSRA